MPSSGYFSYDEQYVSINGIQKYRFLLKDQHTGGFHESILEELGEDATLAFVFDEVKHFRIGSHVTITTDGYHYSDEFNDVARTLGIRVKRQRCLFHILKDLSGKIHDSGLEDQLRCAKHLITYIFFPTPENG